jgi:FAD/FMN-containing dehydrogenase
MTATFATDVTLAEAQRRLAELGQWLPVDGDASWTLGRLVETNSTGPLRLGYGAWRDLLLGCQFQNGRGELITAGGRTVKNVAGYDLTKFMVGQRGVFGRLVTVTARTYLRPTGALLARFAPDVRQINRLLPTSCRPQWAVLSGESTWCGYLGDERTIAYYADTLGQHRPLEVVRQTVEEDIHRRAELWKSAGVEGSYRASVPPNKVLEFARVAALADWVADAAFGVVVGMAGSAREKIGQAAREVGGSVTFVEGGSVAVEMDDGVKTLLERLKGAFDPEGKLVGLPWH